MCLISAVQCSVCCRHSAPTWMALALAAAAGVTLLTHLLLLEACILSSSMFFSISTFLAPHFPTPTFLLSPLTLLHSPILPCSPPSPHTPPHRATLCALRTCDLAVTLDSRLRGNDERGGNDGGCAPRLVHPHPPRRAALSPRGEGSAGVTPRGRGRAPGIRRRRGA